MTIQWSDPPRINLVTALQRLVVCLPLARSPELALLPLSMQDDTQDEVIYSLTDDDVIAESAETGEVITETGERAFIVGDGSAIPVTARESNATEKLTAVSLAVVLHLVMLIALALWVVATPSNDPPQITVSSLTNTEKETIESVTLQKTTPKEATEVTAIQPMITSNAFSNLALPSNFDSQADLTSLSVGGGNAGFGMSMEGFGEAPMMKGIPPGMQSRCSMSQRMRRLRESGGDARAESAVSKGLEFLASRQDKESGAIGEEYTAGMTGLSLLAFLGHCETPESAKFGDAVIASALYLINRSLENDGIITNGKKGHHEAYEHAIATYALCELHTMTKESGSDIPRLKSVIRKSVGIITDAQTRTGGWPYGFRGEGKEDMSVSGWQIQALKAAHNTGENIRGVERALDRATEKYLPAIQDARGAFKYNPDRPEGKATLTGAALLAMQLWKGSDSPTFEKGFSYLQKAYREPSPGGNYYAPYYNTQVFFLEGGPAWDSYNEKFQPRLLEAQNADGSWLSDNNAPRADHQILSTAWAILMLEVYYRYLPTSVKVGNR